VTGAARGIGAAIARRTADEGAEVVINDRDRDAAERTAARLRERGSQVSAHAADVSDGNAVRAMFAALDDHPLGVTGLVNNAGTLCRGKLHEFDDTEWHRTIRVNLDSAYLCLKSFAAARLHRKDSRGSVVNIASMSYRGMTEQIAYVASKGGMVSVTRGAAMELARHGVRVNCIAPGMIETKMTAAEEGGTDSLRRSMLRHIPLRRYGTPEEIAGVAAFLLCDDSAYITGETLRVAGGGRL
jgi:NAD(P)-dependent dehydrogenase (short-subunit alcohol dehydrogenase family)